MKDERILVGIITGAHGLKGEIHIKTLTEKPESIVEYGALQFKNGQPFEIKGIRGIKSDGVIAASESIVDRTAAEALRGLELYITREQLPDLGADGYYHHDLIDLEVMSDAGEEIGIVKAVQNYGASDILDIHTTAGLHVMVPFIDDAIVSVDYEKKTIIVRIKFLV